MQESYICGAVLLHNKIYVLLAEVVRPCKEGPYMEHYYMYAISTSDFKWQLVAPLEMAPNLQMSSSTLTTYHSKLVLVGGMFAQGPIYYVDTLLVSSDGTDWQPSLPPMPTKRGLVTAVNTGSPEILLVAGGWCDREILFAPVEILLEDQWSVIEPLPCLLCPRPKYSISVIHNEILFFAIGGTKLVHCKVESLIAACSPSSTTAVTKSTPTLWKQLDCHDLDPHGSIQGLAFFWDLLLCSIHYRPWDHCKLFAYFPLTQSWVCVLHCDYFSLMGEYDVTLPTGEVVALNINTFSIMKKTLTLRGKYIHNYVYSYKEGSRTMILDVAVYTVFI